MALQARTIHTALGESSSYTVKSGAIWFSVAALTGSVTVTEPLGSTVDTISASSTVPATTYDPILPDRYEGDYVITTAAGSTAKIVEVR